MSEAQIRYQLMRNPSQAQLMAMVNISIERLKDFDFLLASNPMSNDKIKDLKQILPTILLPLFQNSLDNHEDFDAYVYAAQERLNKINDLPDYQTCNLSCEVLKSYPCNDDSILE